jgi:transposase InsO family protein
MHWILTLKDHATTCSSYVLYQGSRQTLLPKSCRRSLASSVFHTDNGKEFTAKAVLEFLWDLNPNILTVNGRPRCPSDHGSVENMNKFVKRTLGTVLAEYRLVGKHPNWTEMLGSIASAINTQHGWGKMTYLQMRQCMGKNGP